MGDRIVVMNGGVVEQIGTPLEVFDQPRNRFVAGFVGSPAMNFIDGAIVGTSSGADAPHRRRHQHPAWSCGRGEQQPAGHGGHPPAPPAPRSRGAIRAVTHDIQPTGVETILLCRSNDKDLLAQTNERVHAPVGEEIGFSVDPRDIHLFDAATGERLAS